MWLCVSVPIFYLCLQTNVFVIVWILFPFCTCFSVLSCLSIFLFSKYILFIVAILAQVCTLHVCMIKTLQNRMSGTTDSTKQMSTVPSADGYDQFVDDGRDETLLMHKGTVSTTGLNLTDPEYTMQMGDLTEQMNRFFRCQYDSSMLSKSPESLKNRLHWLWVCLWSGHRVRQVPRRREVQARGAWDRWVPSRADGPFLQKTRLPACQNYAVEIPRAP